VSNSFFRNFQSVKAEKANYFADFSIATATAIVILSLWGCYLRLTDEKKPYSKK
jgi:hypothetical protein